MCTGFSALFPRIRHGCCSPAWRLFSHRDQTRNFPSMSKTLWHLSRESITILKLSCWALNHEYFRVLLPRCYCVCLEWRRVLWNPSYSNLVCVVNNSRKKKEIQVSIEVKYIETVKVQQIQRKALISPRTGGQIGTKCTMCKSFLWPYSDQLFRQLYNFEWMLVWLMEPSVAESVMQYRQRKRLTRSYVVRVR